MTRPLSGRTALVLGSGISALGAIRVLSEAGAHTLALPDSDGLLRRSRHFRPAPLAAVRPDADSLAESLQGLPERTVLVPCSDAWAMALSRFPAELRHRYPASVAQSESLEPLLDKDRFGEVLERLDLPHPRTIRLTSSADIEAVDERMFTSFFLKPANSQKFFSRYGVKGFKVATRDEARARFAVCQEAGLEMVLQDYILGPPTNHYFIDGFVDRNGRISATFARRRIRMNPPDFGNSTLMVSVPPSEVRDAIATVEALLTGLNYRGIYSAEFKKDDRDGRFKILEVNARVWWFVEFAARCGVDVCSMSVLDALDLPVPVVTDYAIGKRCVYPYYDREAALTEWRAGRLSASGWVRSWLGAYQPVFRWSDPMPAWNAAATLLRRKLS